MSFSFTSDCISESSRHLNWTLKSLKVGYGREDEQLPLRSFTPEMSFPQSSLELLLEGEWRAGHWAPERCASQRTIGNRLPFGM